MQLHTNIPLKKHLTMQIGGAARFMTDAHTLSDVEEIVKAAQSQNIPFYVLGGGSNIIARDETYNGIVLRNRIMGIEKVAEDNDTATFKIGAGENWDEAVGKFVELGLIGTEALSAIPGTCGAAPVQNIGAYGQELSDTLVELEAYDTTAHTTVVFSNEECRFRYRDSIFRNEERGRYVILSITLELYKSLPQPPFYQALQDYFTDHSITTYTAKAVREAVTAVRAEKLPDPKIKPNAGSFFKNAIIDTWLLNDLLQAYPDMPHYDMGSDRHKVPTGWLIEQCNLKGKLLYGMRVNPANALVLINESAGLYTNLARARDEIQETVRTKFRINIEQEPLEMR